VHIHFDAKVAGNVSEVQWHKTQRITWNKDKSIEFYADVDGINEITWWLLGYGDMVKVVTPKILAKRITNIAKNILKN
jgi:predicted DNA-binding transcriptional regulator YafY